MARKKRLSLSERLSQIDSQISEKEEQLKKLKKERKELLEKKKQEDLDEIYSILSEKGMSIDELKNIIS